ncbi:MAG: 5-methylcytosine-specific restriction endonuclease system specificity protein McrC, partial [Cellulosilyticum sp.]|nr:5-methylcytosine-specific restriction endonuclease system specificity protein McrC [Cellulosilyticum sp.]
MTNDKGILIKNIYYMLTYAFKVLKQTNYEEIAAEEFKRIEDLFAEILIKGISQQLKQGLYREYIAKKEDLPVMRGKLDIQGTIKRQIQRERILACEFDELSANNIFNQILKTTAMILIRHQLVATERRKALKKIMLFFDGVDTINPQMIHWNRLRFRENNKSYQMLMNICYFILEGLLQTTERGEYRVATFSEKHMARLYEKFVLEYYKEHHSYLKASASQIKWNLDEDTDESVIKFLPTMQTDITLQYQEKVLIIDAKYYGRTMQSQFNVHTLHSNNLYQIFTYVNNKDVNGIGNVSGMLLYAKTSEAITPDYDFKMG